MGNSQTPNEPLVLLFDLFRLIYLVLSRPRYRSTERGNRLNSTFIHIFSPGPFLLVSETARGMEYMYVPKLTPSLMRIWMGVLGKLILFRLIRILWDVSKFSVISGANLDLYDSARGR